MPEELPHAHYEHELERPFIDADALLIPEIDEVYFRLMHGGIGKVEYLPADARGKGPFGKRGAFQPQLLYFFENGLPRRHFAGLAFEDHIHSGPPGFRF